MKELKFFMFAVESDNPNKIVKSLKGETNLILGIKVSELALARFRSKYIVVQSKLEQFKLWDCLTLDDLKKLKRNYELIDALETKDYIETIAKIDRGNEEIVEGHKVIPLFKTPYCKRFDRTYLSDTAIDLYLTSLHKIINEFEIGVGTIDYLVNQSNKERYMRNTNRCQHLSKVHNKQFGSTFTLDYERIVAKGGETIFGNSLMGFVITDNKEIELVYCTLGAEKRGEFDYHPLIKLLNSGFYLPKNS